MSQQQDNITIVVNDYDYGDRVYLTLTLNCGFCCRYLYIEDQDEMVENNQAFANIFSRYIAEQYQIKYNQVLLAEVNRSDISFFLESEKDQFAEDIEKLYSLLFSEEVDEELFMQTKATSITVFREKYRDARIRALYKMLEFSDSIKCFNYVKFADDMLSIDSEDFQMCIDYMVRPQNCILIVAGRSEHISPFPILFFKHRELTQPHAMLAYRSVDPMTESDAHFVRLDRINDAMGCVKFFFTNPETQITERFLLIQMLAAMFFWDNYFVGIDSADASIIYWNRPLESCRDKLLDCINDDAVAQCRNRLLATLKNDRLNQVQRFYVTLGSMTVHGISVDEYIQTLVSCDGNYLRDLFYRSGTVVTEAQLIQTKMEDSAG